MATGVEDGTWEQIDERTWGDEWIRSLMQSRNAYGFCLWLWLWTGRLRSRSGLVKVGIRTVIEEIGLPITRAKFEAIALATTEQPQAGLVWFPERDYWWVKNYICWRSDRPNLLVAAAKDLRRHPPDLASLAVRYNEARGVVVYPQTALPETTDPEAFPYSEATLRERFGMRLETYSIPSGQTKTETKTKTETSRRERGEAPFGPQIAHLIGVFDKALKGFTGFAKPPGWSKAARAMAGRTFKERLEAEDSVDDIKACIAAYFERKRAAEADAASRGKPRHYNVGFKNFSDLYMSLLREVTGAG